MHFKNSKFFFLSHFTLTTEQFLEEFFYANVNVIKQARNDLNKTDSTSRSLDLKW